MTITNDIKLTIEEVDAQECFRNLLHEQKQKLISLVYEFSLALYNLFGKRDG